jgi:cAMP phosphodiesterase
VLKKHIFNWDIWPDFSTIPSKESPFLHFQPIKEGDVLSFGSRRLRVLPAVHTVPAVGYQLDSGRASLVFTGDTTINPALWPIVNAIDNLKVLIIETAFPDRDHDLAVVSKHLCPDMLAAELTNLRRDVSLYITHLKPGQIEVTLKEIEARVAQYRPQMLQNNQVFEL